VSKLTKKVALVTGGSRGIGAAIAKTSGRGRSERSDHVLKGCGRGGIGGESH